MKHAIVIDRIVHGQPAQKLITASIEPCHGKPFDLLRITNERKKVEQYRCREINHELKGRAFLLTKIDDTEYAVLVDSDATACRCDCIGAERRGWCKHIVALRGLIDAGEMPSLRDTVHDGQTRLDTEPLTAREVEPQSAYQEDEQPRCSECFTALDNHFESMCRKCRQWLQREMEKDRRAAS